MPGVRRLLFLAANALGRVVPVLLVLDPGRGLLPPLAVFLAVLLFADGVRRAVRLDAAGQQDVRDGDGQRAQAVVATSRGQANRRARGTKERPATSTGGRRGVE